jgi:Uncharacterised nucleotidyltransferase
VKRGASQLGSGERRLLLACARLELDAVSQAAVRELMQKPLDWDGLVFFARVHSIAPLVHRHLSRLDDDLLPDESRRRLLALAHRTAFQNRIFSQENSALLAAFEAADLPVIIPKGIPIAERVYGDLKLRPLIDLLFLVPPGRLPDGFEVMLNRGYAAIRVRPPHAAYEWMCPQRLFRREDASQLSVLLKAELIATPPRRHRFTAERFWQGVRGATVAGHSYLTLSPINQILYLGLQCDLHGYFNQAALGRLDPAELVFAKWSNNRLVRFVDLREVIRHHRDELDWEDLVAHARACRIDDALHSSLALANDLLGETAPPEVVDALSGRPPFRLARALLRANARGLGASSPADRAGAGAWERLGPRRQKELFTLVGLINVAFPGVRTLRAENPSSSLPSVLAIALWQALATVARSVSMFLRTAVGRHGAPQPPRRLPDHAEPGGELAADRMAVASAPGGRREP